MSTAKKAASKSAGTKKSNPKPLPTHPSWAEIIKECITSHPDEARTGVSRPQIKKYADTKYKIEFGAAQTTQLNKAIAQGAKKGIFVLPKGLSGKVKLPPKKSAESSATKENKPTSKTATKPASKSTKAKSTTAPVTPAKKATAAKASAKPVVKKPAAAKKTPVKKVPAKKTATTAKKASSAKKAPAKKAATGATKAKTAAAKPKAPAKKIASKASTRKSK